MAAEIQSDLFKFVSLRPANLPDYKEDPIRFIKDEFLQIEGTWRQKVPRDLMTESNIGNQVLTKVEQGLTPQEITTDIVNYFSFIPEDSPDKRMKAAEKVINEQLLNFDRDELMTQLSKALTIDIKEYTAKGEGNSKSAFEQELGGSFDQLYALYIIKRVRDINLEYILTRLRILHVIEILTTRADMINSPEELQLVCNALPIINPIFALLRNTPFNNIKPIGVGDLKVVKQWLTAYKTGEVAHIENVLKGESKERTHRRLDRTENILSVQTEKNEQTERETQTTERFELKQETEKTIQQDLSVNMGTAASAKYGTFEFSVNAGFAFSQSSTEARRTAANFAKDIVDRSLTNIQKSVREERTTKDLHEIEETNKHGLINASGPHISGIYHWVDKHYKAQVFNYGKRMMFEFVVPEPAAFLKYAQDKNKVTAQGLSAPIKPAYPVLNISQISNGTVDSYAALYSLGDLDPMPAENIERSVDLHQSGLSDAGTREIFIEIPESYVATSATISGSIVNAHKGGAGFTGNHLFIGIGGTGVQVNSDTVLFVTFSNQVLNFPGISNKANFTVLSDDVKSYTVNFIVHCQLTSEAKRKWQIETYTKIMDGYNRVYTAWQAQMAEYQDKLDGAAASAGIQIKGKNPLINAEMIRTEVKKHCITLMAKEFDSETADDIVFDAMKYPTTDFPAIDIEESKIEGKVIQFLEQAFEWNQISYILYPYFWAARGKWVEAQTFYDEEDPMFAKFLQAGAARILVAVHPAYEIAVLHFLYTREPWNGGPAPGLSDLLYIPIHEEIHNQQDDLNGATAEGEPWDVTVPTTLVYLKDSTSELPTYN